MPEGFTGEIAKVIIEQYKDVYPELKRNEAFVLDQLALEETRFAKTLKQGNREFEKLAQRVKDGRIDGESAFHLYDTYGFPVEMTCELAKDAGLTVDMEGFEECFKKHQATSQAGAEQRFKGGLADHSDARPPVCTPPPICCTRPCARCWATKWLRRAPTSPPSACASTSPSAAR